MNNQTKQKTKKQRLVRAGRLLTPLALSLSVVLTACGSDDNSTDAAKNAGSSKIDCATGSIAGSGSTFVQNIVQQWVKDYQAACPGSTINYQGVGSGTGITQFTNGQVDFAASDVALKASEQTAADAKHGKVITIPWAAGGVAVEYHLTGVEALRLSPATLAGIFSGAIKTWGDPAIAADNTGRRIPDTPIQVVHRSDGSGTTAVFTEFLTATAPQAWTVGSGKEVAWPIGQGQKGSDGVTALVKQTEGAIGYAELSFAKANGMPTATIKNEAGKFVGPDNAAAVTAALAEATIGADLKVTPNYKPMAETAYPLSSFTYAIVPSPIGDAAKGKLISSFMTYALAQGQDSATGLGYAPLPTTLVDQAKAVAAQLVTTPTATTAKP